MPTPVPADRTGGRVTVVVATRDRADDLLASLPRHEAAVVVVDNASTEEATREAVRRARPDATLIRSPRNLGATARGVGAAAARTPYVAFADDDSWWSPGALARAADLLDAHPRCALLAARVLVGPQERLDPVSAAMARAPLGTEADMPGPTVGGFLACAAVVRREAFLAAGGFDPVVFFGGEEERLALDLAAAGWGLAHADELVVHHHPSPRRSGEDARRRLVARNAVLTAWMRRPWSVALARTLRTGASGPTGRGAVRDALVRLPRALARRRVVPPAVERRARLLEDVRGA